LAPTLRNALVVEALVPLNMYGIGLTDMGRETFWTRCHAFNHGDRFSSVRRLVLDLRCQRDVPPRASGSTEGRVAFLDLDPENDGPLLIGLISLFP